MKVKNLLITGFLSLVMVQETVAQNFNEVEYSPSKTVFTLFAPDNAAAVKLRIYDDAQGGSPVKTVSMKSSGSETYTVTVDGDLKGKFYTFDVGKGECAGVFATAVGVNGKRGAIVNLDETDPAGWDKDRITEKVKMSDLVIYEMHHRDFSIDPSSGLKYKGKFLALTEPRAIEHLKRLGVNAVHILPSFDYASVDETRLDTPQYNWGYDPLNYNVPEGSYSTDPYNPVTRIREFKQMVQALHKAGIRVILDVVYNHTFNIAGSNFQLTYPDYFYRKTADGKWSDGSGCGNETASERPGMREFMKKSMLYWVDEYHIDGFRVDLMGVHDIETMNEISRMFSETYPATFIYGEGWSAGTCAYPQDKLALKANMKQMPAIAAFGDDMRDALRGPFNDDAKGAFIAGVPGNEESIKFGIAGAIAHPQVDCSKVNYSKEPWTLQPWQHLSYVSCHDDMCLVDRLRASVPGITMDELIKACDNNFEGQERLRQMLLNKPEKYGNDSPHVDAIYKEMMHHIADTVQQWQDARGGYYAFGIDSQTMNIPHGEVTGALPDGRLAGEPFCDASSPMMGRDAHGPTATVKSVAGMKPAGFHEGALYNLRFDPHGVQGEAGKDIIEGVIKTYFQDGGQHIQINVVDNETLRKAQKKPEDYKGLMVRVAGYMAYFTELDKSAQDVIIDRTAHLSGRQ